MRNFLRMSALFFGALLLVALIPVHAAALMPLVGVAGITANSVGFTTTSDFAKGYRRATTVMYRTYTRQVPEYQWFDDIPSEEITPSARENLIPLDTEIGYGAHQVSEGGKEARTDSPTLLEGSFLLNQTNARIGITLTEQAFDDAAASNAIIKQIKYKSLKAIEAVMRKWAYMTYGTSTGILCQVANNPASGTTATVTLGSLFNQSGLGTASYLAKMFPVGEHVGFVRSGVLVGIASVTANSPSAGTISVTFNGDTVDLAAGDQIVYANAVLDSTLAGTDYNKWNYGWFDALVTDTVMGVSKTTDTTTWAPALYDTNGGSFGFVKARQLQQALEDNGDTVLKRLILSRGVLNDKDARERAALIYTNPGAMSLDGSAGLKGVSQDSTRFVPPTCAFAQGADAAGKVVLTSKPGQNAMLAYSDLRKSEDNSLLKGGFNIWSQLVWRSRSRTAAFIGLDEQGV